jgi:hydroxymethylbilane synthase
VSTRTIAVGSRGSALARIQANLVISALEGAGVPTRLVIIETAGDRRAPDTAWGEGAFVAAIEDALLDGRVDVAVHSAKDVPVDQDPRLRLAAFLPRADPRDALVVRHGSTATRLEDLPSGARVGTDSPRRTGFLRAIRPDLNVHPLHGNVDTRLRRLDEGQTDALILACAGLDRLGLGARISERLDPGAVPPAPGQAAIAVQIRSEDGELGELVGRIDDRPTRRAVEAERGFLAASGGGCRAPIGALARVRESGLELLVGMVDVDGGLPVLVTRTAPLDAAQAMVEALAEELGARDRLRVGERREDAIGGAIPALASDATDGEAHPRVLVPRADDQSGRLVEALRAAGLDPVAVPAIEVNLEPAGGPLDRLLAELVPGTWIVLTSANGGRAVLEAADRVGADLRSARLAAVGGATAAVLADAGLAIAFRATRATAATLATELPIRAGDPAVVVRGDLAEDGVAKTLGTRGAVLRDVIAYRTREAPQSSIEPLRRALSEGPIHAVAFTSGSTVRGLLRLGDAVGWDPRSVHALSIGPETDRVADAAGFAVRTIAPRPDAAALAAAAADALIPATQEIA